MEYQSIKIRQEIVYFLLGISFIALSLCPYWLFGKYSALGWFDEYDAIIPWYLAKNVLKSSHGFMHQYAGGTGGAYGFASGDEFVSLYRLFLHYFDIWVANFLIRFFGMASFFLGVYYSLRTMQASSRIVSFSLGLFALFATNIPYGWTLGGIGWDLSAAIWLCIILFQYNKTKFPTLLLTIAVSSMIAITSPFLFLIPLSLYMVLFYAVVGLGYKEIKKDFRFKLCILFIYLSIIALNWFDSFHSMVTAKLFSARIHRVLSLDISVVDFSSLIARVNQIVADNLYVYYLFFTRMPTPLLAVGYAVALGLTIKVKAFKRASLFILFSFVAPILLDVFFKITRFPLLEQFRWNELWELQSIMLAVYIALMIKSIRVKSATLEYKISFILLVTAFIGAKSLISNTFINMAVDGGIGVTRNYQLLNVMTESKGSYRFISTGDLRTTVPLFYGLDTFDGVIENFPFRRNYFVAYAVNENIQPSLNSHSHVFFNYPNGYDLNMLKLANVKYVISNKLINDPAMKLIKSENGLLANDVDYYFKSTLNKYLFDFPLMNTIYLYQIEGKVWPRVFSAESIEISQHDFNEVAYYQDLKKIQYNTVLFAASDKPSNVIDWNKQLNPHFSVLDYKLEENKMIANVTSGGGILVFNQVQTPMWTVSCHEKKLSLIPVNGIMMATLVPKNCNKVIFSYIS